MATVCESIFSTPGGPEEALLLVAEGEAYVAGVRQDSDAPEGTWAWNKSTDGGKLVGAKGDFVLTPGIIGSYQVVVDGLAFRLIDEDDELRCAELVDMFASVVSQSPEQVQRLVQSANENMFQLPGDVVPPTTEPPLRSTPDGRGYTPTTPGPGTDIREPGVPYTQPPGVVLEPKKSVWPWLLSGVAVLGVGVAFYKLWRM